MQIELGHWKEKLKDANAELKKMDTEIKSITGSAGMGFAKLGGLLTKIGIAFSGMQIGGSILNLGDKLEQANISFEVMLGSAEKAKKMLADLSTFAKNTPFELQGIRDSAKQLMAMGIPAEKMIQTLKVLGDISAGTGAPLQQIAYAYGQVATAGIAKTQDMNQLVNAGIDIF